MCTGCCGYNNKQVTYIAYGMAYGLLCYDMIERFLLHYFAMSAHTYTRGTWTTPEATHPDRDVSSTDYVAAGVLTSTTYLKWMLLFEEPESQTVWVGKATPREWLQVGQTTAATGLTTRYGRVSLRWGASLVKGIYTVHANVTLTQGYAPTGGVKVRLRTPLEYLGRLTAVTVGGAPWDAIDSGSEAVVFSAAELTPETLRNMQHIIAVYK